MTPDMPRPETEPTDRMLAEIERNAVDLARLAGTEIQSSLGRSLSVRYKASGDDATLFRDPVSEVDHRTEVLIRARLEESFPDHGIIGEEQDEKPADPDAFVWAVDPIDGTTNFVNGFPLFAAAIGVLHRGRPVVGAVWCSTSHALRPGVYHARAGGRLFFEDQALERVANPDVQRQLVGQPHAPPGHDPRWDTRKTGSAAIETAFVAAGLLQAARFDGPNVWDVAAGIVLVEAAGGTVLTRAGEDWRPFAGFTDASGATDPRRWRSDLVIGRDPALGHLAGSGAAAAGLARRAKPGIDPGEDR